MEQISSRGTAENRVTFRQGELRPALAKCQSNMRPEGAAKDAGANIKSMPVGCVAIDAKLAFAHFRYPHQLFGPCTKTGWSCKRASGRFDGLVRTTAMKHS
jgi:hypothetical protein